MIQKQIITTLSYKKVQKNWYKIEASCNHDKIVFFRGEGCKGFLKELMDRTKLDKGKITKL